MAGYLILVGYGVLMFVIYKVMSKGNAIQKDSVENMIFAGGRVKSSTLAFSIFAAWMWTTSILGASETYLIYGIWGPLGYVIGACIAFGAFVPFVCGLQKKMPQASTYLEFIGKRYGKRTKYFFYMFAFIISAYVLIEQAVGIAYIMETFFGSSFKWVAFFSVMPAVAFICLGGMKCLLTSEKIASLVIFGGFLFFLLFFLKEGSPAPVKALTPTGQDWLSTAVLIPAFRYFIMAIVIGFSQLVFDPAYYIKGKMAKDLKQLKWTYLVSGILLWGSLTLISSLYLGWASVRSGKEVTDLFSGYGILFFSIVMAFIGISTVSHYLMGMLGIFSTDYYTSALRPKASDKEKLVFGRVMVTAIGIFCALIAISLEDISLLTIDVFCAIFFAAPCGPFIIGFISKRQYGPWPVIGTAVGIIGGLLLWIFIPARGQLDQFLGMAGSLGLPLIFMLLGRMTQKS